MISIILSSEEKDLSKAISEAIQEVPANIKGLCSQVTHLVIIMIMLMLDLVY